MCYRILATVFASVCVFAQAEDPGIQVQGYLKDGKTSGILSIRLDPNPSGEVTGFFGVAAQASNAVPVVVPLAVGDIVELAASLDRTAGYVARIGGESTAEMLNNKFSSETTEWGDRKAVVRSFFAKNARTANYRTYYELGDGSGTGVILDSRGSREFSRKFQEHLREIVAARQAGVIENIATQLEEIEKEESALAAKLQAVKQQQAELAESKSATIKKQDAFSKQVAAIKAAAPRKTGDLAKLLLAQ